MSRRRTHAWRVWLPGTGMARWRSWCGRELGQAVAHAHPPHESDCLRCLDAIQDHCIWRLKIHSRDLDRVSAAAKSLRHKRARGQA